MSTLCLLAVSSVFPLLLAFLSSSQALPDGTCRHARRFWVVSLMHLIELVAPC